MPGTFLSYQSGASEWIGQAAETRYIPRGDEGQALPSSVTKVIWVSRACPHVE